jgi:hypothetical protein
MSGATAPAIKPYLSLTQIARALGLGFRTVQGMRDRNQLPPARRIGEFDRYSVTALADLFPEAAERIREAAAR